MKKVDLYTWLAMYEVNHGNARQWGNTSGIVRVPAKEELDNYFRAGGMAGYVQNVHWCGIFQVYLLKKAGVRCSWSREIVDDSGGADLEITQGQEARTGLRFGDILKVSHNQHHFMALEAVEKGSIRCIEGNAGGVGNPLLATNWALTAINNTVETIQFRYRVVS